MVIEQFPDCDASFAGGLGLREPLFLFWGYGPLGLGERKSRLFRGAFMVKECAANFLRHYPFFSGVLNNGLLHSMPSKEEILCRRSIRQSLHYRPRLSFLGM